MNELFRIGFLTFTYMDVLDILLITGLFYIVYRSLRDTVAIQVLVALAVVFALSFITESANLKTANWILRRVADIGLIAFIVLFQPELRRVMLLFTQSRLFRLFIRQGASETIDDVVEAVRELSAKHIGALIVFSSAEHIKVTVDTGVRLQAQVSPELLLSIFHPRSPLHDGAVIIDGRLIVAARCVLPLSSQQRVDNRNLGTRHRAGLGISEQAAVLVIIVSEETGMISIAAQGELESDIPPADLKHLLVERLSELSVA